MNADGEKHPVHLYSSLTLHTTLHSFVFFFFLAAIVHFPRKLQSLARPLAGAVGRVVLEKSKSRLARCNKHICSSAATVITSVVKYVFGCSAEAVGGETVAVGWAVFRSTTEAL